MATLAASAAAAPSSSLHTKQDDDDASASRNRLEEIRVGNATPRPSTVMAQEFLNNFGSGGSSWKTLPRRLSRLCEQLKNWNSAGEEKEAWLPCAFSAEEEDTVVQARRLAMTAAVLAQLTTNNNMPAAHQQFYAQFESLFAASLHHRDTTNNNNTRSTINNDDDELDAIFSNAVQLFENLQTTGWIRDRKSLLYRPLMTAIQSVMYRKVKSMASGDFETTGTYQQAVNWKNTIVEPWLRELMGNDDDCQQQQLSSDTATNTTSSSLTLCTAECYCWVRLEEMFDMVTSFPDSLPAVTELRDVLELTGMHNELAVCLRDSLMRRLNHPGADTSQIIDVYINTIKVLRIMDNPHNSSSNSTDRLLSVTTEPVRTYLRGRSDTVRCIITSLTDADAGGDLYQELRRQDAKPLENVTTDSDDEEDCPDMNWQPPPPLSLHHQQQQRGSFLGTGRNGDCDILAMLVSIYGSKELFVNEYRLMLADKLLANLDYNTDKEVHTLELLKLRFGELSMVSAEVMIKDIEDSVRSNKNIRDSLRAKAEPVVDAAVISHIFWPKLQNEQLKHHPRIQAELDDFSNVYAEQKNPRKLIWMNQLGSVQLELDVVEETPDGPHVETKEFACSPLLATLISHFEDKPTWTTEELSNETGVPEHSIQKRMAYWITNRVVTFSSSDPTRMEYTLASRAERLQHQDDHHGQMDDDGHGGQAVSASAQEEEEMEVYESYISVMLTSLQQAPLDKIHNMLKMMVSGSETKYNKTPQQLNAFLQHLCRQEKLECGPDGMYKLLKK